MVSDKNPKIKKNIKKLKVFKKNIGVVFQYLKTF